MDAVKKNLLRLDEIQQQLDAASARLLLLADGQQHLTHGLPGAAHVGLIAGNGPAKPHHAASGDEDAREAAGHHVGLALHNFHQEASHEGMLGQHVEEFAAVVRGFEAVVLGDLRFADGTAVIAGVEVVVLVLGLGLARRGVGAGGCGASISGIISGRWMAFLIFFIF